MATGATVLGAGVGVAEAASSGTVILTNSTHPVCERPGWVGAATRTATYMSDVIDATSLCSRGGGHGSGIGTALVRAWITSEAHGTIEVHQSTANGRASVAYKDSITAKSLRGYTKLRSSNLYDYETAATLYWQNIY